MSKIIDLVKADLEAREQRGISKYGTTVDRTDLSHKEWLQHAYEEALDMAVYLKRAMNEGVSEGKTEKYLACEKYLNELPNGYREKALSQINAESIERDNICKSITDALWRFESWVKTKEGGDFWNKVYSYYVLSNQALPPLPND